MSSAMVSTLLNDDLTAIQRNFHDFPLLQRNSAVDKAELVGSAFSVCGLLAGGGSIARRHSSSIFVSAPAKPVTNIPSFADSNNALVNNGILETVAEERFRSRAYSEGSSILSCDQQQQQPNQSTSRYKTELCRPFEENGRCKYGDKCQFAHGKHEMRQMVRHPKYKTELCRTYHTDGICPYGPRCHFIHNTDDPAAMPRQNSMNGIGMQSQPMPMSMPVAINNQASQKRPTNLQLMSQHRTVSRLNSFPAYTPSKVNHSPIGTPPGFYGLSERPMLSPVSPNTNVRTGPVFSFSKAPMSPLDMQTTNVFGGYESISTENRQGTPPLSRFDIFTQGTQLMDLSAAEDGVFERPISPPDSDRESESGSPQGSTGAANNSPQRLPIFRCLSQSD